MKDSGWPLSTAINYYHYAAIPELKEIIIQRFGVEVSVSEEGLQTQEKLPPSWSSIPIVNQEAIINENSNNYDDTASSDNVNNPDDNGTNQRYIHIHI